MKIQDLFEEERSVLSVMGKQNDVYQHNFSCAHKKLTSLKGAPSKVIGDFECNNNHLTTLEGAPSIITWAIDCSDNYLTSLQNIHKIIKYVGQSISFSGNDIKSNVLGLLMIEGLTKIFLDYKGVQRIVNKHLAGDRDVFACQEELIEAGFPEYAKL